MATKKTVQPEQYARETINYSVAATDREPAADVTLVLTYSTTQTRKEAAGGYFHVSGATGRYTVLNADGTAGKTYPITGLISPKEFDTNNNRLYPNSSTILDKHGVSFEVSMPTRAAPQRIERIDLSNPGAASGRYLQHARLAGAGRYNDSEVTSLTTSTRVGPSLASSLASSEASAAPVCFAAGARILTTRGEIAVEALAVGDQVVTASGAARPIRWLGHRTVEAARHPRPREVMPVRIAANAFGPAKPARELRVSPGHALCLDALGEVLIPAGALVNGTTIRQEPVERVTYWHVELETHDVLLAENIAAESYLEMGNRNFFAESSLVDLSASPDAKVATHADFCRPFVDRGPLLEAIRARLEPRAASAALPRETRAA